MKNLNFLWMAFFASLFLTSCEAIGDIFQAGMWWGIILVFGVIGLIIWLFTRGRS